MINLDRIKRLISRILRLVCRVLIYFTAILLTLGLFLSTQWTQDRLKAYLIGKINSSGYAHLEIRDFKFALFSGVLLSSIQLQLPLGKKLSISELYVELSLWRLLAKELIIKNIIIFDASVILEDGNSESTPLKSGQEASLLSLLNQLPQAIPKLPLRKIVMENYRIHEARFLFNSNFSQEGLEKIEWMQIKGQGHYSYNKHDKSEPKMALSLSAFNGWSSLLASRVDSLGLELIVTEGNIELTTMSLKTKESQVAINGSINPLVNRVDLRLRADPLSSQDLKSIRKWNKLPIPFENSSVQMTVNGLPDGLRFSGVLNSGGFHLETDGIINLFNLTSSSYSLEAHLSRLDTSSMIQNLKDIAPELQQLESGADAGPELARPMGLFSELNLQALKAEQLKIALKFSGRGLKPEEVTGTLALSLVPATNARRNFKQTEIVALIDKGLITIKEGILESEAGVLNLQGSFNLLGLFKQEEDLYFRMKVRGEKFNLAMISGDKRLASQLNFHFESDGHKKAYLPWKNMEAQLRLDIKPSILGQLSLDRSSLKAAYHNGKIKVEDFNIDWRNNHLLLKGFVTLERAIDLNYKLKTTDFDLVALFYPQAQLKGQAEGTGTIRGIWPNLLVDGKIKILDFSASGWSISAGTIEFSSRINQDKPGTSADIVLDSVNFRELKLEHLKTSIKLNEDGLRFDFSTSLPEKGGILVSGKGENILPHPFLATLSGRRGHSTREAGLIFDKFEIGYAGSIWRNTTDLRIKIGQDRLSFKDLKLVSPPQEVSVTGFVTFSGFSEFDFLVNQLDLDLLYNYGLIKEAVHGSVDGKVYWQGTLSNPRIEILLHAYALTYRNFSWDHLELSFDYQQGELKFHGLISHEKSEILHVKGLMGNIEPFARASALNKATILLELRSSGLNLAVFAPLLPELDKLSGIVTMAINVNGRVFYPSINGTLHIRDGQIQISDGRGKEKARQSNVYRRLIKNLRDVSAKEVQGNQKGNKGKKVNNKVGMAPPGKKPVTDGLSNGISVKSLALSVINLNSDNLSEGEIRLEVSDLSYKKQKLDTLLLSGKGDQAGWLFEVKLAQSEGNYLSTEALVRLSKGLHPEKIEIQKIDIEVAENRWHSEGSIEIDLKDDALVTVDSLRLKRNREEVFLKGRYENGEIAFYVEAQISDSAQLAELLPINKYVKLRGGNFVIKASIEGSLDKPELNGTAQAQTWEVAVPSLEAQFKLVQAILNFDGSKVELEKFVLEDQSGSLTAQGHIEIKGFKIEQIMIETEARNFRILNSRKYSLESSGKASLTGSIERPVIKGDVIIRRGRINLKKEFETYHSEIKFSSEEKEKGKVFVFKESGDSSFWGASSLNVKINVPGNFWIKGDNFSVELEGGGALIKESQQTKIYTGSLHILRGNYQLYGKNFNFAGGMIEFPGISSINPYLNLETIYRVSAVKIIAQVRGTLDKPELSLKSDPPLPETEIFSYLAFGKASTQLTQREASGFQSQAAGFLGGKVTTKLKDFLGEKFSLETVEITGGQEGLGSGTAQVGKYLSDNLFLEYGHSFGSESSNKVSVEYKFGKYFTLNSDVGGKEQGGVDLLFNLDY